MATLEEIGRGYGLKIRSAVEADGLALATRASITESTLRSSRTARTLKEIQAELETWTIGGLKLTPEQRGRIIEAAAEALGGRDPQRLAIAIREASNDEYTNLANTIWNLLIGKR